jgi:transcriptional regulator with XRE-family HTH domain
VKNPTNPDQWPDRLRQVRIERNFSQADLANAAGYSQQHISKLETGDSDPSLTTLRTIAAALKVHVCSLLDEPCPCEVTA